MNFQVRSDLFSFRPIFLVVGVLIATLGCAMMLPAIIDLAHDNDDWQVFAVSSLVTIMVGVGLWMAARGLPTVLSLRQAFVMTVMAWVMLAGFGALPLYWSGLLPSFTDAFFESMSGLTTTGATVITNLDSAPPGLLFWRGLQQWLGGLGIIVMAIAVFPMLQVGGMQLFKAEAFDTPEKILPRATQISSVMTLIFITFTAACFFAYLAAGMSAMDAIVHAMTTVATGGFSTKDASLGHFDSDAVELIAITFMILGSLPFLLYVKVMQGRPDQLIFDSQVIAFFGLLTFFIAIVWLMVLLPANKHPEEALILAAFNVVSIMTGTGYASADYHGWGPTSAALFMVIMFIGGCAGSTSCGIKVFRFQVIAQDLAQHVNRIVYPNGIFVKRFNGRVLPDSVSAAVFSFLFLYIASFAVLAALLSITGVDNITALSGAATAISNVGPGLGQIIGPAGTFTEVNDVAKWLLAIGMLVGRLEIFTVLVLFMPQFWRI